MARVPTWLTSQDSKLWPALGRVSAVFGIVTPLGAIATFIATGHFSAPAIILSAYICVLVTVLVALLLRQERQYLREVRYAPAMLPMRKAFSEVANASWHVFHGEDSQDAFRLRLRESLRRFAEAFTLITGNQCRACIKVIQAPSDPVTGGHELLVSTLCRDNEGTDPPRHAPDRIGDNTDFKQIFTENKACYFSNDLLAQLNRGYRNSHWQEHDIENGTLDYRATIVWPIEHNSTSPLDPHIPREIVGFLCVDTLTPGAFLQTYDEAIGAAFAQALYLAMHRFRESSSSQHGPSPVAIPEGPKS